MKRVPEITGITENGPAAPGPRPSQSVTHTSATSETRGLITCSGDAEPLSS